MISLNMKRMEATDPGKLFAITEMGYHTSLGADTGGGWEGVDVATQAKLLLNTYLDAAELNSQGTYLQQLLDSPPTAAAPTRRTISDSSTTSTGRSPRPRPSTT